MPNGGAGGTANGCWDWHVQGGSGNTGGAKKTNNGYENVGASGTGGLLIIYVNGNITISSTGIIESNGTTGTIRAQGQVIQHSTSARSGHGTARIIKTDF